MKNVLFILLVSFVFTNRTSAQFSSATVGINGLTCSLCQKGVEKEIRHLSFVQDVNIDLEKTTAQITFKPGSDVSIDDIAKKIESAGFTVRSLVASYTFNHFVADERTQFKYGNATFEFVKVNKQELNGSVPIKFIGENYMTKKDYSSYKPLVEVNATPQFPSKEKSFYFVTE